ncbi:MAG: hypothetical protein M1829_001444 [Trizodia sp. TS-e1964]|nr:MAG: hypothetical protein M1829_001444 [Trizodia sp. TS-e1964]
MRPSSILLALLLPLSAPAPLLSRRGDPFFGLLSPAELCEVCINNADKFTLQQTAELSISARKKLCTSILNSKAKVLDASFPDIDCDDDAGGTAFPHAVRDANGFVTDWQWEKWHLQEGEAVAPLGAALTAGSVLALLMNWLGRAATRVTIPA